jgi:hypothetical protein
MADMPLTGDDSANAMERCTKLQARLENAKFPLATDAFIQEK